MSSCGGKVRYLFLLSHCLALSSIYIPVCYLIHKDLGCDFVLQSCDNPITYPYHCNHINVTHQCTFDGISKVDYYPSIFIYWYTLVTFPLFSTWTKNREHASSLLLWMDATLCSLIPMEHVLIWTMQYHVSVHFCRTNGNSFIRVLYIPLYSNYYVPLLLFYVFIAVAKHNITEAYGAQARCYEHSDECNSTVSFSCLATQLVQHNASGLLAYYINTDGKYMCYSCQYLILAVVKYIFK